MPKAGIHTVILHEEKKGNGIPSYYHVVPGPLAIIDLIGYDEITVAIKPLTDNINSIGSILKDEVYVNLGSLIVDMNNELKENLENMNKYFNNSDKNAE